LGDPFTTQQTPRKVAPDEKSAVSGHAKRALLWEPSAADCSKLSGEIVDCTAYRDNRIRPPLTV
jgi:hypothetical protein